MGPLQIRRYPGYRRFEDTDYDRTIYFGRKREVDELLHLILAEDTVIFFGKSGAGKSSLLRAGLLEQLRQRDYFPFIVRFDHTQAAGRTDYISQVAEAVRNECQRLGLEYEPGSTDSLWGLFKTLEVWRDDTLLHPILIIDQFEELFTLLPEHGRVTFIEQLGAMLRPVIPEAELEACRARKENPEDRYSPTAPRLKVVLTLREDYVGHLDDMSEDIPGIFKARFRMRALTRDAARACVVEPARAEGAFSAPPFEYSPELVEAILDLLSSHAGDGVERGRVEAFQLQVLCQSVEEIVYGRHRDGKTLSRVSMVELGGLEGLDRVLRRFVEDALTRAAGSERERQQLLKLCGDSLLSADGHRLSVDCDELIRRYRVRAESLASLAETRLLVREPRLNRVHFELSHDTLAAPVQHLRSARRRHERRRLAGLGITMLFLGVVGVGSLLWLESRQLAARERLRAAAEKALAAAGEGQLQRSSAQLIEALGVGTSTDAASTLGWRNASIASLQRPFAQHRLSEDLNNTPGGPRFVVAAHAPVAAAIVGRDIEVWEIGEARELDITQNQPAKLVLPRPESAAPPSKGKPSGEKHSAHDNPGGSPDEKDGQELGANEPDKDATSGSRSGSAPKLPPFQGLAVSSTGKQLVALQDDGQLHCWQAISGSWTWASSVQLDDFDKPGTVVLAVASDSSHALVGQGQRVWFVDACSTGSDSSATASAGALDSWRELDGSDSVSAVAFSADGQRALVWSESTRTLLSFDPQGPRWGTVLWSGLGMAEDFRRDPQTMRWVWSDSADSASAASVGRVEFPGAYLARFGWESESAEAPPQFSHYFVVARHLDDRVFGDNLPIGTIVRGDYWDATSAPAWRAVDDRGAPGETIEYQELETLSYLGPEWRTEWRDLGSAALPEPAADESDPLQVAADGGRLVIDPLGSLSLVDKVLKPTPAADVLMPRGTVPDSQPMAFTEYFRVTGETPEPVGTLVRGLLWDGSDMPRWQVIAADGSTTGDEWWIEIHALEYLGPDPNVQVRWQQPISPGAVAVLPAGEDKRFVAGFADGQVLLLELAPSGATEIARWSSGSAVTALSPGTASGMASGHRDGRVRIWRQGLAGPVAELACPDSGPIRALDVLESTVAAVSERGVACWWQADDSGRYADPPQSYRVVEGPLHGVALRADASLLLMDAFGRFFQWQPGHDPEVDQGSPRPAFDRAPANSARFIADGIWEPEQRTLHRLDAGGRLLRPTAIPAALVLDSAAFVALADDMVAVNAEQMVWKRGRRVQAHAEGMDGVSQLALADSGRLLVVQAGRRLQVYRWLEHMPAEVPVDIAELGLTEGITAMHSDGQHGLAIRASDRQVALTDLSGDPIGGFHWPRPIVAGPIVMSRSHIALADARGVHVLDWKGDAISPVLAWPAAETTTAPTRIENWAEHFGILAEPPPEPAAPEVFRHYFQVNDDDGLSGDFPVGAIVRGDNWDGSVIPGWALVDDAGQATETTNVIPLTSVDYLGPDWPVATRDGVAIANRNWIEEFGIFAKLNVNAPKVFSHYFRIIDESGLGPEFTVDTIVTGWLWDDSTSPGWARVDAAGLAKPIINWIALNQLEYLGEDWSIASGPDPVGVREWASHFDIRIGRLPLTAPEIFNHYFQVREDEDSTFTAGTVVTGVNWDQTDNPEWALVDELGKATDSTRWIEFSNLDYLGSDWELVRSIAPRRASGPEVALNTRLMDWEPSSRQLVAVDAQGNAHIWQLGPNGLPQGRTRSLSRAAFAISDVRWSPGGDALAVVAGRDRELYWVTPSGRWSAHGVDAVGAMATLPSGQLIYSLTNSLRLSHSRDDNDDSRIELSATGLTAQAAGPTGYALSGDSSIGAVLLPEARPWWKAGLGADTAPEILPSRINRSSAASSLVALGSSGLVVGGEEGSLQLLNIGWPTELRRHCMRLRGVEDAIAANEVCERLGAVAVEPAIDTPVAALRAGRPALAEDLLRRGQGLPQPDETGISALWWAVASGDAGIVDALLQAGADVDEGTPLGDSPLALAAARGELEILRRLLQHGAEVNAPDRAGLTPLVRAVLAGQVDAARALLVAGADATVQIRGRGLLTMAEHNDLRTLLRSVGAMGGHGGYWAIPKALIPDGLSEATLAAIEMEDKREFAAAADAYLAAARDGEAYAASRLSRLYHYFGVPKLPPAEIVGLLQRHVDDVDAELALAISLSEGQLDLPADPTASRERLQAQSELTAHGKAVLGDWQWEATGGSADWPSAVRLARESAEAEQPYGLVVYGEMLLNGLGSELPASDRDALAVFERLGDAAHPTAITWRGRLLEHGRGRQPDLAAALAAYETGRIAGNADAAFRSAWMYEHGLGVPADRLEAGIRYREAMAMGDRNARIRLRRLGWEPALD